MHAKVVCTAFNGCLDFEEDAQILSTLLKHISSCLPMNTVDMEQPPVVIPARTVRQAVHWQAGDLPSLDADSDAANVFSQRERILQGGVRVREAALKLKILQVPASAFVQCYNFANLAGLHREELHQFRVCQCLYGEYIVSSTFHLIAPVQCKPEFILSCSDKGDNKYLAQDTEKATREKKQR
jgi:hypothetical protein